MNALQRAGSLQESLLKPLLDTDTGRQSRGMQQDCRTLGSFTQKPGASGPETSGVTQGVVLATA